MDLSGKNWSWTDDNTTVYTDKNGSTVAKIQMTNSSIIVHGVDCGALNDTTSASKCGNLNDTNSTTAHTITF